jgi:hypothetical protein
MVMRWTRKALVLSVAAAGVQYARAASRVLAASVEPEREREQTGGIFDGRLVLRGTTRSGLRVVSTPDQHGAL